MSSFSMPSLASMKSAVDELRAQVIPKNETEKRVYEALSSKNWGASTTMLNEIAQDSYDYEKYGVIMKVVWDIINSQGSSWKQVFKAVSLLEFLVKNGAERTIEECRDNMRTLRRLQEYNYFEGTADKGSGTREKAKQLVELLGSNDYIREEREKAQRLRDKFTGVGSDSYGNSRRSSYGGGGSYGGDDRYGGRGGNDRYGGGDRYGGDRYGGGGSDRYGGSGDNRHDSYDSSSFSSGGGYGDGGLPSSKRYSGGSGGRRSTYNDSNDYESRGGGSYDSSRSGGYSDEPPVSTIHSSQAKKLANTPVSEGSGGKIKIKIKNAESSVKKTSSTNTSKAEEHNFFESSSGGDNFFQDSTPSASTTTASQFDAFGSTSNDFAAFQSAPVTQQQQPSQQQSFDAFQTAPAQQQQQPVQQQQFDMFQSAPVQQPNQFDMFQSTSQQQQTPQQQFDVFQSAPVQQQPIQQHATDNDFGDFEGPSTTQVNAPVPQVQMTNSTTTKKADKMGGLVNLDNLSLGSSKSTTDSKTQQSSTNSSYSSTAFAGLDGFSKSTQPMHMGAPPQMNNMGGGGGGMRPVGGQMNMPMGQQMGMMGGQMGMMGGQQPMGGNMGMMGTQQPHGGQMGMMGGQQMGGQMNMGGQHMGGMNMMGQPQMGGMNMGMGNQQHQQQQNRGNQFGGAFNF